MAKGKKVLSRKNMITIEVFQRILDELLAEKPLDKISTSEIIERSGLSRGTFYKHFRDKYELANWRILDFMEKAWESGFSSESDINTAMRDFVLFLDNNKDTFKKILEYEGQNSFEEYFTDYSIEVAREFAESSNREFTQQDAAIISYHVAGELEVLREWAQDDGHLSAEDAVEVINICRSESVRKLYLP